MNMPVSSMVSSILMTLFSTIFRSIQHFHDANKKKLLQIKVLAYTATNKQRTKESKPDFHGISNDYEEKNQLQAKMRLITKGCHQQLLAQLEKMITLICFIGILIRPSFGFVIYDQNIKAIPCYCTRLKSAPSLLISSSFQLNKRGFGERQPFVKKKKSQEYKPVPPIPSILVSGDCHTSTRTDLHKRRSSALDDCLSTIQVDSTIDKTKSIGLFPGSSKDQNSVHNSDSVVTVNKKKITEHITIKASEENINKKASKVGIDQQDLYESEILAKEDKDRGDDLHKKLADLSGISLDKDKGEKTALEYDSDSITSSLTSNFDLDDYLSPFQLHLDCETNDDECDLFTQAHLCLGGNDKSDTEKGIVVEQGVLTDQHLIHSSRSSASIGTSQNVKITENSYKVDELKEYTLEMFLEEEGSENLSTQKYAKVAKDFLLRSNKERIKAMETLKDEKNPEIQALKCEIESKRRSSLRDLSVVKKVLVEASGTEELTTQINTFEETLPESVSDGQNHSRAYDLIGCRLGSMSVADFTSKVQSYGRLLTEFKLVTVEESQGEPKQNLDDFSSINRVSVEEISPGKILVQRNLFRLLRNNANAKPYHSIEERQYYTVAEDRSLKTVGEKRIIFRGDNSKNHNAKPCFLEEGQYRVKIDPALYTFKGLKGEGTTNNETSVWQNSFAISLYCMEHPETITGELLELGR